MNKIYWEGNQIGIVSNSIESEMHQHSMIQLFLGLEGPVLMTVNGVVVQAECIIVGQDVPHHISTNNKYHFMYLIAPVSELVHQIKPHLNEQGYWIVDKMEVSDLVSYAQVLIKDTNEVTYLQFIDKLYETLDFVHEELIYDERIQSMLTLIENCDCYDHRIENYADKIGLSASRLSHLFKDEVGVPLKSYLVLHQVRMVLVALLMGMSISDASLNAGFNTPSHFASTVKRMMGTPASLSVKDSVFLKVNKLPVSV